MANNKVDIKENYIRDLDKKLLSKLLCDRSTKHNIIWAINDYSSKGHGYSAKDEITADRISGHHGLVIKPRSEKSKTEIEARVKNKAEVFTPSWICNIQNNFMDEDWFSVKEVFNTENEQTWTRNDSKIPFPTTNGKTWQDYVNRKALEITCGEAPYLVSRYDTVTGEIIEIENRIGILDRKLRVVGENVDNDADWLDWTLAAFKSVYGYEWQGDNIILARENLLFTFIDYYLDRFGNMPTISMLNDIADIITWNIWQMDGLKYVVPNSCKRGYEEVLQLSFFEEENMPKLIECEGCAKGNSYKHNGIYPKIKNWKTGRTIIFNNLKGGKNMKFDFVIGNPPYQMTSSGDKPADDSVYHYFMDAAYGISDKVMLITPSKFLFRNGNTPAAWNEKMLADRHFKVLYFNPVARNVFSNVTFKGGVAIHYRDKDDDHEPILQFSEFPEMNSMLKKVLAANETSLTTIIYNQNKFNLDELLKDYPHLKDEISSNGREKRMTSGCLKYACFHDSKISDDDISILGLIKSARAYRFIDRKYLEEPHENFGKYKVIVPANNGSGAIGEVLSTPLIGEPLIGFTQTFISIGAFDRREQAENALKYVKSKFCRTMLGVLKVTQNGKREMWKYVPLQDFTTNSDIDWSQSVAEIDAKLYEKYGLTEEEIKFIETHVKEME